MRTVLIFALAAVLVFSMQNPLQAAEQVVPAQPPMILNPLPSAPSLPETSPSEINLNEEPQSKGYTLDEDLIYRINFGRKEDVKFLLDKGANPNARTKQGDPVLSVAIERDDKEAVGMVKVLLDKGADPNQEDRSRNYPIVSATKNGQPAMVAALIEKGADFQARSPNGTSVLDLAKINGNPELIKIINDEIAKENAFAAELRKPERYKQILNDYAFNYCIYQYWQFFYTSHQDTKRDDDTQKKMARYKTTINLLIKQIQRYYPFTATTTLERIASISIQQIYNELDVMISNSNRAEHGVGTMDDDTKRCHKIVDAIEMNVAVPQGYTVPTGKTP